MKLKFLALPVFLCCLQSGCNPSSKPKDLPPLQPCSITLTQEGKGLAGAEIMLWSVDPSFKWTVAGQPDSRGVAVLKTHGQFPGAPVGEFKIVVTKTEHIRTDPSKMVKTPEGNMSYNGPVEIVSHVEKQYADPQTTPLTITISKGGNDKSFDLGKAVEEKRKAPSH